MSGWIGVDLDGTLAYWHGWGAIGEPVPAMLNRVKYWLNRGQEVRIFTARASVLELIPEIQEWSRKHVGQVLQVTCVKDLSCLEIWDDRAVRVPINTGEPCCDAHKNRNPLPVPPSDPDTSNGG